MQDLYTKSGIFIVQYVDGAMITLQAPDVNGIGFRFDANYFDLISVRLDDQGDILTFMDRFTRHLFDVNLADMADIRATDTEIINLNDDIPF